jgi:hypothetical protein
VIAHLTVESKSEAVRATVADFAHGLGCEVEDGRREGTPLLRITMPESTDHVLELMSHIALSATRALVDLDEPLCRVSFRHRGAASVVTLGLRVTELDIAPEAGR